MGCECIQNSEGEGKCNSKCGDLNDKPCESNADCTNKNSFTIDEFKKITKKRYNINYTKKNLKQKGGNKEKKQFEAKDKTKWTNEDSFNIYNKLVSKIGEPNKICTNSNGITEYAIWQDDYDNVNYGRIGGLDFIKVTNYHARKWHPLPADVYIIAGKYLEVPDHLLGPIKYASETINVEQLFVEHKSNKEFGKTGKKGKVLVTGSCASVDISTVTVAFVEDMIKEHKDNMDIDVELHQKFQNEYDNRIKKYIETGKYNPIEWYDSKLFN